MTASSRILIVEDEYLVVKDLTNRVKQLGYQVVGSTTKAETAIDLAQELKPDLVLMDIILEGHMDGIAAAEKIRSTWQIPVVFLTACSDPGTVGRAIKLDLFGYIIKPFDDHQFQTTIQTALQRHRFEQQLNERNRSLMALNQMAVDLAAIPSSKSIHEFIARRLKELTHATACSFAVYDAATQCLNPVHLEIDPSKQDTFFRLIGVPFSSLKIPIPEDYYALLVEKPVRIYDSFSEVSMGSIPTLVSTALLKLLQTDHLIGVSYVIQGKLYGTSLLAIGRTNPSPAHDFLHSFAHITAISIRRQKAEESWDQCHSACQLLIENRSEAILLVDDRLCVQQANAASLQLWNLKLTGQSQPLKDLFPSHWASALENAITLAKTSRTKVDFELVDSGNAIQVTIHPNLLSPAAPSQFVVFCRKNCP